MKKIIKRIFLSVFILIFAFIAYFLITYFMRFQSIGTIKKLTNYKDYNVYSMNIKYDYSIDNIIDKGITDTQSMVDAIVKETLPLLPIKIELPDFGCSVFSTKNTNNQFLMGRNYDFKYDTSALMVYCQPKDGYKSVAFAALNNVNADDPQASLTKKMTCLTAPFICLDGMNEKGVSIAVLTLDSKPTKQETGKQVIATSLAIRLVLDKAATTEEAIELLSNYDMYAANGRDYHFYITDASGDGRVVEYDCDSKTREMVVTSSRTVTNFYVSHIDQVLPNQNNDPYGHGKERYDAIEEVLTENENSITKDVAWQALEAAAQDPNPNDVTSNTQWSIVYNNTKHSGEIVLRRKWNDHLSFKVTPK